MNKVDCVVIGGGVVGLAIGAYLAKKKLSTIVLESESSYGQGVSSRNSEVIHAGIYYPSDSLKSKLCVRGKSLLYDYCNSHQIPFKKCGKMIVATCKNEIHKLDSIRKQAFENGVKDLKLLSKTNIKDIEPNIEVLAGLFSPSTGIIDSHQFMSSMVQDIEQHNGIFISRSKVTKIYKTKDTYTIEVQDTETKFALETNFVINAAGLKATEVAEMITDFPINIIPKMYMCKGTYFKYMGKPPFTHLIYPIPPERGDGLGIHSTIDMLGQVKFGPDVEYIDHENYLTDDTKLDEFYNSIIRYFPSLEKKKIVPDYCGIRPKLQGPNDSFRDFTIMDGRDHNFPGLIQLFGIESPGLTASLAIAEYIGEGV